jgi:EAL domain-containing protein (putative c-di-GMP-specific phosphodiesterase class I)
MNDSLSGALGPMSGLSRSDARPDARLLLVSRSAAWRRAVRSAADKLGGRAVDSCQARDALSKLACASPYYSHLLVDQADADGLLDELADLAEEVASPDTRMLVLGRASAHHPKVQAIAVASAQSVAEALLDAPLPRESEGVDLCDVRAALDGAQIETRYQPIVRLSDRWPVALEALARLNHPQKGTLQPDRFIPMIEKAGLADRLTELVSARALSDLTGVALAALHLRMSLNFPLDVLLRPDSLRRLEEQRLAAGIAAERITVELTESRPVEDFDALRRSLEWLRGLGYGAAIDDAGPTMSSLRRLIDLPFTSLKLDKDLVQQAASLPRSAAFLSQVVQDSKRRGLLVVAEGVETPELWTAMRAIGADEAQGFLAARPLPLAAVPIWRESWAASR